MARVESGASGILVDGRWVGAHGIGRFAAEVLARLPPVDVLRDGTRPASPLDPLRLSWLLRRRRPRAFFSPGFNAPLSSPVPYVLTLHDLIPLRVPEATSPWKRMYFSLVVRTAARRAFKVLTVSNFSRAEILAWTGLEPDRVAVVPPAPSSAFVAQGDRADPGYPYFLYVGGRKLHKNLQRLFAAVAAAGLPRAVRLAMTGDADTALTQWAGRHGVHDRVVFLGPVDDLTLARWYRGALAVIVPSLYEGFGLPALEAMACGTAVVASDVAALPEIVGDAGLLVGPRSVESIAEAIRLIADDAHLRKQLGRRGVERARRFTWEATAAKIWAMVQEAAGR